MMSDCFALTFEVAVFLGEMKTTDELYRNIVKSTVFLRL